VHSRRDP